MSHSLPRIPHSKPFLPEAEEWAAVTSRLAPGWAADGPCTREFAQKAAAWLGGSGGVAVNSGSNALHLALLAVGAGPGTEVLVPAYCCAALLNAVSQAGATPVLVDAEPGGFNLCPQDAARRVNSRTAAIVVAHLFGCAADLTPFLALGIPVVEDCAQSLGARDGETFTGGRGAIAIGSFYATKVITTGHGGLVSSANPERVAAVADRVDYDNREDWEGRFNYRMSELQAALGLWQLERLPGFLARRRELAAYYHAEFQAAGIPAPDPAAAPGAMFYRYVLRVADADETLAQLQALGIDAKRPVYRPLHHYLGGEYPHAQAAYQQLVSLPIYPGLTDAHAERVKDAVCTLLGHSGLSKS